MKYYFVASAPTMVNGFRVISAAMVGQVKKKDYIIPDYASALYTAEIDPETVGQYTGLTDVNDNKIFEGDIVWYNYEEERGIIQWDNDTARFIITCSTFTVDFDNVYGYELEIVGNVYDNPEHLERGISI